MSGSGDFISREALLQAVLELPPKMDEQGYGWLGRRGVWQMVSDFPAADVRPVVLCRDCIFRSNEWTGCPKLNGTITGDDFFCKCGIKRGRKSDV